MAGLLGHTFLKNIRISKGYTLRTLSIKTGISHTHIKAIEDGKKMPGVDTLYTLCQGLGIHLYDYLDEVGILFIRPDRNIKVVYQSEEERVRLKELAVQGFEPRTLRI